MNLLKDHISPFLEPVYVIKTWATLCLPLCLKFKTVDKRKEKRFKFRNSNGMDRASKSCKRLLFLHGKHSGFSAKTKSSIVYPSLPSAIQPQPHSDEVPIPVFTSLTVYLDECDQRDSLSAEDDDLFAATTTDL